MKGLKARIFAGSGRRASHPIAPKEGALGDPGEATSSSQRPAMTPGMRQVSNRAGNPTSPKEGSCGARAQEALAAFGELPGT
jgi:hypothetical protein